MKRFSVFIAFFIGMALAFGSGYLISAEKPMIDFKSVRSPAELTLILNAIDTEIDALRTLANELRTDHATTRSVDGDQTTLANNLRSWSLSFPLGNPNFAISSNFDIQNGSAFSYCVGGVLYSQAANQTFDTGTAATFAAGKWGIGLISITHTGGETITWDTNEGAGFDSEALAIAALPSLPGPTHCPLGYVTVQAHAANTFTAGTDALQGGTGGNASPDTNYYNMIDALGLLADAISSSPPAALSAPAVTEQVTRGK